ncbi:uncharacterized protein LOC126833813 [Adelges cooleyi]|uniref:uncharacterized protein LOC126833813 n=1 Tax=Adelges cooleyi TaxID=133065 RepID=UPI00218062BC|nr:uncharacterized protein LOC126833813 [Adelges cooleyi]
MLRTFALLCVWHAIAANAAADQSEIPCFPRDPGAPCPEHRPVGGAVQSTSPRGRVDDAECEPAGRGPPPSVTLCANTEFREPCVHLILLAGGCTKLAAPENAADRFSRRLRLLNNTARSVHTRGTCIRLYANGDCTGDGPLVYPGSASHHDLSAHDWDGAVGSVGPCAESSGWYYQGFRAGPLPDRPVVRVDDADSPIVGYQTGHGGRVEYVDALVYPGHVAAGCQPEPTWDDDQEEERLLGALLGGPGAARYNVIKRAAPADRRNPAMVRVEQLVRSAVRHSAGGHVRYELNPVYDYAGAISPDSVAYRLTTDGGRLIQQGLIPNLDTRQLLRAMYVGRNVG